MYVANKKGKSARRKRLVLFIILLLLIGAGFYAYGVIKEALKPQTTISQSKAVQSVIRYDNKMKHYDEPDFGIDLPANWQPVAREAGAYQTYTWQVSDRGTEGQQIMIFEDTIPPNATVNRALVVAGEGDHLTLNGEVSDDCTTFTKNIATTNNRVSVPAKWMGIDFLCDGFTQDRNVTGTSSSDGLNTVILRNPGTGQSHKFFFMYTTHSKNPDYTTFYAALRSLKMQ
ncbi:MAG: hypothetical protein QFB86_02970 [Patescibacteria group bacterium]|nr:hypothetical protein [Patescibacteria group bacterium]